MRFCVLTFALCLLTAPPAAAQYWTGPYQLTSDTFTDINPSACKEWLYGGLTCMVWQTNRSGNWDICSRFCNAVNGNGWGSEELICTDSAEDVNPAVACCNDWWLDHPSYWCVWERRLSPVVGSVWASHITFRDQWGPAESIGYYLHTGPDSARPAVIVIRYEAAETAWVAWAGHDTDAWYIEYTYNAGGSWTTPGIAIAQHEPIHHVRLGRGHHNRYYGCPLLTWESNGDIFYTEYLDGSWQVPQGVAHSAALDRNPDIVSHSPLSVVQGAWITWESTRDGDTAICGTAMDTFSVGRRWCDASGAGSNFAPCGTPAEYTTDIVEPLAAAWVSDRAGNPDIYSSLRVFPSGDCYVDNNPATDINPTITTMGLTMHWCCWQSNRSGNWDIWGSYVYCMGVEEPGQSSAPGVQSMATIARGVLFLPVSLFAAHIPLFDMTGRQVMSLHPGPNDVRGLVPGVYFVAASGVRSAVAIRKVVVTR